MYTLTLTPIEEACGVTLEAVQAELVKGLVSTRRLSRFTVKTFTMSADISPALAGATARAALASPVAFSHLAMGKYPVYSAQAI